MATSKTCTHPTCDRPRNGRLLCAAHYWRQRHGKDMDAPIADRTPGRGSCLVGESCGRVRWKGGYCTGHYNRRRAGEPDWDRPIRDKAPDGSGTIDEHGYRRIWIDGSYVSEHRYVMEQHLGRPLLPSETVHHKTGGFKGRSDNRLSNLELWTGHHPTGHRVEDVVAYCREMLALYGDDQERARYA